MWRKILLAVGTLALLACAGAAYSHNKGAVLPLIGARPLAEVLEAPLASGDSTTVARFAETRCRFAGSGKQPCYEEILLALVERSQVRLAMDALSVLSRNDHDADRFGHDLTHVVGINGWSPGKDVGKVYESCTGLYQSGCYHGVVQAYLDANGTDSATVYGLCNNMEATTTSSWLRFQCVHGIGHGLVQNTGLHLRRALEGCDWLVNGWDAQSCYGGAFMEFIVAGRGQSHHPHKKAAAPAADSAAPADEHAEHGEHDHAAMTAAAPAADTFAIRNPNDPLYPCSALAEKYWAACYGMQAGIVIEIVGADFGKISAACEGAPLKVRPFCYQGVGTYISGYTVRNAAKSIELCGMAKSQFAAWCHVGVVKNFIDVTSQPTDGVDFCNLVTDRVTAVACYNAIGEQINVLFRDLTRRETECAKLPVNWLPVCRYGAGLGGPRSPELDKILPVI